MSDLAAVERVTPPSMTGIVARLEERGLVSRDPNPDDARSTVVSITNEAKDLLVAIRDRRTAFLAARLSEMTDEQLYTLSKAIPLLEKITEEP
jgi:DNA-binding MarR family transcriptional regulator